MINPYQSPEIPSEPDSRPRWPWGWFLGMLLVAVADISLVMKLAIGLAKGDWMLVKLAAFGLVIGLALFKVLDNVVFAKALEYALHDRQRE